MPKFLLSAAAMIGLRRIWMDAAMAAAVQGSLHDDDELLLMSKTVVSGGGGGPSLLGIDPR